MLPFEFFIEGPPVSQQTRRRSRLRAWVAEVRRSAERTWPADGLPFADAIMITLTYLYDDDELDLDNLAKPVLDALKGLVFLDDQQVTDLVVRKRNLTMDLWKTPRRFSLRVWISGPSSCTFWSRMHLIKGDYDDCHTI